MKHTTERQHYIDNLRFFCTAMLIPYHAAMAWNCWGEGNYILLGSSKIFGSFIVAVSPWYMALLFVLAGMSAKYSAQKRTPKQFVKERVSRLFVPFVTATVTVVPVLTFIADKTNCGYSGDFINHYSVFFTKFTDITGYDGGFSIGHLWFIICLFIISLLSLIIIPLLEKCFSECSFENISVFAVILLFMVSMLATPLKLAEKSILSYLLLYLLGYCVLSSDKIIEKLIKYRYIYLVVWMISTFFNVYLFLWSSVSIEALNTLFMYLSGCFGILVFLSFGKSMLNRTDKIMRRLTADSFLIYIFHFVYVVVFEYAFSFVINNDSVIFILTVLCSFVLTLLTCEIVKVIPIIHSLFGMKRK